MVPPQHQLDVDLGDDVVRAAEPRLAGTDVRDVVPAIDRLAVVVDRRDQFVRLVMEGHELGERHETPVFDADVWEAGDVDRQDVAGVRRRPRRLGRDAVGDATALALEAVDLDDGAHRGLDVHVDVERQ